MTYKLSHEAFLLFRDFQLWYEDQKRDERLLGASDAYMTAFGKIEGLTGRLALMFHVIENPFSQTVSVALMERVIEVIRGYVVPTYRYTLGEMSAVTTFDTWVTEYIIQHCDVPTIKMSDIKQSARRPLAGVNIQTATQRVVDAMYVLEQSQWVHRMDDRTKENQGIAEWAINPALAVTFAEYRKDVIRAKQRMNEQMVETSKGKMRLMYAYGAEILDAE